MRQSDWSCPFIRLEFTFGMHPFSSGLAGSLSLSLCENYSMEEFKECGVQSLKLTKYFIL